MAKKTTKAKRPPSPYNQCMSTALKGKKGSKEEVRANFKEASASCKTQSKKPLYSANPVHRLKCAYCGSRTSLQEIRSVDEKSADMDGEELEMINDSLPKKIGSMGEYIHEANGIPILNICQKCFDRADELSMMDDEEPEGLGLASGDHDGQDDNEDEADSEYSIDYNYHIDDYEIDAIPDAVIMYYPERKLLVIESRGSGDYEFPNVNDPKAFLKQKFPQK